MEDTLSRISQTDAFPDMSLVMSVDSGRFVLSRLGLGSLLTPMFVSGQVSKASLLRSQSLVLTSSEVRTIVERPKPLGES